MASYRLRAYEPSDAEAVYGAVRESLAELRAWMPWCHPDYALAEARSWVESRAQMAAQGLEFNFAIVDESGGYVGGCGLNQINPAHLFANLGYWVRTARAGKGAATAAVGLLTDWAFRETDLQRLEIVCAVGNERSQRVAARAGAVREGVLRHRLLIHGQPHDAVMFSLTREQKVGPQTSGAR